MFNTKHNDAIAARNASDAPIRLRAPFYNCFRISHRSGNAGRSTVPRRYSAPVEPPVPRLVPIVRSTNSRLGCLD